MKLTNELQPIRNWANEKGIYSKGDVKTQIIKLFEETGELSKSIMKNDKEEFIDAIGDIIVVLVSVAELGNEFFKTSANEKIFVEDCINSAYEVIAKRTGKMVGGTFVKDK